MTLTKFFGQGLLFAAMLVLQVAVVSLACPVFAQDVPVPVASGAGDAGNLDVRPMADAKALQATQARPFIIYMVLWQGFEDAARGFKNYLTEKNVNFRLVVRDAKGDAEKTEDFVREIRKMRPDLVVTWGTTATLGVFGTYHDADPNYHITDIPGVFMVVSQPVAANIVSNFASSGRNITGTSHLVQLEEQIAAIKQFMSFKKLGVIYNPKEGNSTINVERLKMLAPVQGFEVTDMPVPLNADNAPDPEKIPVVIETMMRNSRPDIIYQGPDAFLNVYRDILTTEAMKYNVPVFSVAENSVRLSDALFGVGSRYYNVGILAGNKAWRILVKGESAADIPVSAPKRATYLVNMRAARKLGLYPPLSILDHAELINVEQ